jgi:hypothetical protein
VAPLENKWNQSTSTKDVFPETRGLGIGGMNDG